MIFCLDSFFGWVKINDFLVTMSNHSSEKCSGVPNLVGGFISFQRKVGDFVKFHIKSFNIDNNVETTELPSKESVTIIDNLSLERQMCAWKDNPVWTDRPPNIKVTVPKGSLCNLSVQVDVGLPPDAVYNIVTDPDNKRVFKNIKEVISRKVLVDEGLRQLIEVEQAAIWKFLWWSGTISVQVLVDQNREDHTMKFKQTKSGFMEKFEGCWKVEPLFIDQELCHRRKPSSVEEYISCSEGRGRIGSKVRLEQLIQPAIVPPPPISWYVRGITTKTTEMLITDLLAETARIRATLNTKDNNNEISGESTGGNDSCNVKERWAIRRRKHPRHYRKRLS